MKLLFLSNNSVSKHLIEWLSSHTELSLLTEKLTIEKIEELKPDIIISYSYKYILGAELLAKLPNRFVNLHISLLPYNRGADPNAWSFLENTPKGVSIHLIDEGIDTGDILFQKEVIFDETSETLGNSYQILHEEIQALFRKNWDIIKNNSVQSQPQTGIATFHKASEFAEIKESLLGVEGWGVPITVFKERYESIKTNL